MRGLQRRIEAIEAAEERHTRHLIAIEAAKLGLTVDEFVEEMEDFFAQPLAKQLAKVDGIAAACFAEGIPWPQDDVEDVKATLTRSYRP